MVRENLAVVAGDDGNRNKEIEQSGKAGQGGTMQVPGLLLS